MDRLINDGYLKTISHLAFSDQPHRARPATVCLNRMSREKDLHEKLEQVQVINTFKILLMENDFKIKQLAADGLYNMASDYHDRVEASGGVSTFIDIVKKI